ncbi:hypothetical protein [Streptomyces sp. NPDC001222]|uniref:hypothetical protein n=1 Tax=Streptomyces sp. NPDC001222 TaxID=3364548 RepID=UPI003697A01E
MSPEHGTPTPSGPTARGRRKKVGGLASVALLVTLGLVTPAAAIAHTVTTHGGVASADGGKCKKDGKGKDKCKKPKPKPTPTPPPTGCNDIDSAVQGMTKYVSVVCSGQVRVLSVNEAGPNPPTPVAGPGNIFWQSVGGPTNVFDATLAVFDAKLLVTELTSTGEVWQGICTSTLPLTVPCTFTQMPTPPNT